MPLPHSDLLRFQNQMIPRYTLSASGPSSNLRKVVAAQQLSLIRSPDCAYLYEKCGLATLADERSRTIGIFQKPEARPLPRRIMSTPGRSIPFGSSTPCQAK